MTALVEEHAERQRRCCARIQEEHGVLAASLEAAAAAHAAAKLRADNAAEATEMKERGTRPLRRRRRRPWPRSWFSSR